MKKILSFSLFLLFLSGNTLSGFAGPGMRASNFPREKTETPPFKAGRTSFFATSVAFAQEVVQVTDQVRQSPQPASVEEVTTFQQRRQEIQSQFRQQVQERQEAIRANVRQKQETFRQRLREIKDDKKRAIVERISTRINNLNKHQTDHFSRVLERLARICEKLQTRIDRAKQNGKDTTTVQSALDEAKEAIRVAQEKVLEQAGKSYIIEITSEETLREAVQPVVKQFGQDLQATREAVKNARKAVIDAFRQVRTLGGLGPVVSPTAQPVVQPTTTPSPEASQ